MGAPVLKLSHSKVSGGQPVIGGEGGMRRDTRENAPLTLSLSPEYGGEGKGHQRA